MNTLGMAFRTMDIAGADFLNVDMRISLDKYPDVDYRYFIIPPLFYDYDMVMTFNHDVMMKMMKSGAKEAEKIINQGPNGKKIIDAIRENREDTVKQVMKDIYLEL